uniref:Uncharacterized protein n=1 Tax=Rhizophora mucronata TaxID=61149 RepID=A0A2P2QCG4_RHIMU
MMHLRSQKPTEKRFLDGKDDS